jgi:hypothetical protein
MMLSMVAHIRNATSYPTWLMWDVVSARVVLGAHHGRELTEFPL